MGRVAIWEDTKRRGMFLSLRGAQQSLPLRRQGKQSQSREWEWEIASLRSQ
jgi:hypothetical protein